MIRAEPSATNSRGHDLLSSKGKGEGEFELNNITVKSGCFAKQRFVRGGY